MSNPAPSVSPENHPAPSNRWWKTFPRRSQPALSSRWILCGYALLILVVTCQLWWPERVQAQSAGINGRRAPAKANAVAGPVPGKVQPVGGQLPGEPRQPLKPFDAAPNADPRNAPEVPPLQFQPMAPNLDPKQLVSPAGLTNTLNLLILLTVLSLAPSILIMTTCFVRFVIVLGLLRQALGTQTLPPNQVLIGISLFLTLMVMSPIWKASYEQGLRPYTAPAPGEVPPSLTETFDKTVLPIRRFMSEQIENSHNAETVWLFVDYQRPAEGTPEALTWHEPETYDEVPLTALLPAYLLSELKTSFIIGFQIYLPFLIVDMVIASILISMGMMMLPPAQISLPFKLLLFVLIDGWTLTVGMLIASVRMVG